VLKCWSSKDYKVFLSPVKMFTVGYDLLLFHERNPSLLFYAIVIRESSCVCVLYLTVVIQQTNSSSCIFETDYFIIFVMYILYIFFD